MLDRLGLIHSTLACRACENSFLKLHRMLHECDPRIERRKSVKAASSDVPTMAKLSMTLWLIPVEMNLT